MKITRFPPRILASILLSPEFCERYFSEDCITSDLIKQLIIQLLSSAIELNRSPL